VYTEWSPEVQNGKPEQNKGEVRMKWAREPFAVTCLSFAFVAIGLAQGGGNAEAWATDWSAFVKRLSAEATKQDYFVDNVNAAFSGKKVTWTGSVTKIEPPKNESDSALIFLSMKSVKLELKSGPQTLDRLTLVPKGDDWKTWKSVTVGDTVLFTTTLDHSDAFPCVLAKMNGFGSHAGETIVWINTKGGSCLKIVAKGSS
jgi:hypothetical protein